MFQLKKSKYLKTSITLSIISISLSVFINIQIAREYLKSDGKTRALFGIKEILQFGYQYYVCIFGVISLIMAILSGRGDNRQSNRLLAILLSLFSVMVVFVRLWRLFVLILLIHLPRPICVR
jgi:hypothetical protein